MKELSIEEKAKLYDEAIQRAKRMFSEKELNYLFPELKESEDEKILKAIIEFFELQDDNTTYSFVPKKDILAWLEKQAEKKPAEWHREDEQNLNACLGYIRDEFLRRWLMDAIHAKYDKPSDKPEPKFNVGDWVVDEKGVVKQILSYKNGIYKHTYGYSSYVFEDEWKLWDITKDAKDGDILCTYVCDEPKIVFILKGTPNIHYALDYHCYYNIIYPYFETDSEKGCLSPSNKDVRPATKEQCDLLFQKMKEKGYEWDAEKKELKKIEQKSAWSEEDEKNMETLINVLYAGTDLAYEREINWLKSLKERVQTKQEWSEEDEKMLDEIHEFFDKHMINPIKHDMDDYAKFIKSLKESLKDRVQPHSQWKPSEEQMEFLYKYAEQNNYDGSVLTSLYQELKKLKEE